MIALVISVLIAIIGLALEGNVQDIINWFRVERDCRKKRKHWDDKWFICVQQSQRTRKGMPSYNPMATGRLYQINRKTKKDHRTAMR